ncbi:transcription factor AS1-like [Prosopis cineraria]|uniref:transcription factor AS1-like n=1 Tax=Prosopis cineraria TaxID=364024 RepID=UPI0024104C89|nr:transcription factor AS1-like [Prosopis cineraria]
MLANSPSYFVATSNKAFILTDAPAPPSAMLPSWLSNSSSTLATRPSSLSVTLSLSPSTMVASSLFPWLQPKRMLKNTPPVIQNATPHGTTSGFSDNMLVFELDEYCKELEEGHRALSSHRWRLKKMGAMIGATLKS